MKPFYFTTKSGKRADIREIKMNDVKQMLTNINAMSAEDTFIGYSGEQLTLEDEEKYVRSEIAKIKKGNAVKLVCFVDGQLAGSADVNRDTSFFARKRHQGIFGLIVAKQFRGEGIGKKLLVSTIENAWKEIPGLLQIRLECFSTNEVAIHLYQSCGFREVGRVPNAILHRGNYVDEVIMLLPSPQSAGIVH